MKTWEKWWLRGAVMVVVMVLLSASPVFAKSNQVDKEGETYQGKMTLVTNTNFDISNDEAFKAALSTGETAKLSSFPEASPLTDQMAMQQCGTLAIDQGNVDLGEVRTTAEATPAVTYKVGDKKELSMIVGINADQSEQFEKITHTCLATGEHCTVWYADTTQTEAAQNLAAKFDGYYAKMVNGFGSPEAADVDHDGKVAVVVTSMDSIIAGYFWDEDLTREGEQMDRVNINQRIAYTAYLECTLCHEFQHLINFAQVGKNRDSWLNEVFSQSAPVVAGVDYEETTTMANLMLTAYIKKYQQTIPFIFKGDYVPLTGNEAVIVYAEWFLFSRYLSAQTQGYSGGGDTIYKTILNYDTEDGEHACTREVLTNVLKEKGVISTSGNDAGLEGFVRNYNIATILQEDSGVYGFNSENIGFNFPTDMGNALPSSLWGGGAAALSLRDGQSYTPEGADAAMRFAGITQEVPDGVYANRSKGETIAIGDSVTLSAEDGMEIYYTIGTGDDLEDPTVKTGTRYTEPIVLTQTSRIKAIAWDAKNETVSKVKSWIIGVAPAAVTASVESGKVVAGQHLALATTTEGARILYTTDGSDPAVNDQGEIVNGMVYRDELTIARDTTVRAIAYMPDQMASTTSSVVKSFCYTIRQPIQDRYEPNNSIGTSTAISFPTLMEALISTEDDVDDYSFTLDGACNLNLTLSTANSALVYPMTLMDEEGNVIQKSSGDGDQSITTQQTPAGKYYLKVESKTGSSDTLVYTLNLEKQAVDSNAIDLSEMNMLSAWYDETSANKRSYAFSGGAGGGHYLMATQYYSLGDGPVLEKDQPYSDASKKVTYKPGTTTARMTKSLFLPNKRSGADVITQIKNAVINYGAVYADVYVYQTGFDKDRKNYYAGADYAYSTERDGAHAITIVGWDDNYSKENFNGDADKAKQYGYLTFDYQKPTRDGAFIVKNSWGKDAGEEGYFYLSYETADFANNLPSVYLAQEKPAASASETQYYNDQLGMIGVFTANGPQKVGQVFKTGSTAEQLKAVSFINAYADSVNDIYLRIGDTSETIHLMQVSEKYCGYYKKDLAQPITLPANTRYEIILRADTAEQGKATGIGLSVSTGSEVEPVKKMAGISYYYNADGSVYDMGLNKGYYANLRAFTTGGSGTNQLYSAAKDGLDTQEELTLRGNSTTRTDATMKVITTEEPSASGETQITSDLSAAGTSTPAVTLPSSFDLRKMNAVTSVKDQGNLGSCWTFASTASMESTMLRQGLNAYDYPTGISLNQSDANIVLGEGDQSLSLIANVLGASNPTSTRINWSFSGDLDSVDLTNNVSFSGEKIPLLTAKTSGTVVVTATSDADVAKSASCTLRITKPGEKVPEPGTPGIRKNVKTGTATGTVAWIAAVLMLGALLALVIYSFRKDRPV